MMKNIFKNQNPRSLIFGILGCLVLFILIVIMAQYLPPAVDWHGAFRPGSLAILRGDNPYQTPGFIYPPWTSLILLPFAIFPEHIGRALLFVAYFAAVGYTAHKLGGNRVSIPFVLLSPPVLHGLLNGNIDGLIVLGFVLPPWLGLFLLVIKPQISYIYVIYLFIQTLRTEKFVGVLRMFAPVTVAYLLSLIFFGLWPIQFAETVQFSWNASLWPLSIPIGLALFVAAIRNRESRFSIAASPFMSPYVLLHSWVSPLLAIVQFPYETIAAVLGLWIVFFVRLFI